MYSQAFLKLPRFFWFAALLILVSGSFTKVIGKDDMEVRRDKDKTTYSIGVSEKKSNEKTEEEKDKERAWDMLKNMNTVIDKREQNRQKNGQPGGQ
jgi:hypothetical protein